MWLCYYISFIKFEREWNIMSEKPEKHPNGFKVGDIVYENSFFYDWWGVRIIDSIA
jgi:hypothetical protein